MKLASFDIFDTVLIRKCGRPENIFYILAQRLFPEDRARREEFLLWRRGAERNARRRCPGKDVSLSDIYNTDTLSGLSTGYSHEQMMDMELHVESDNLMANPAIKSLIGKKRSEGYRICFISDMYIGSHILREILSREGCICEDEKVYVSCEHNARKSDGRLFDAVKEELSPEKWLHWGDNMSSDVRIPRKKGIEAHLVDTAFNEIERMTLSRTGNVPDGYVMSILAGLQRAARIRSGNDPFVSLASDYIVPAYVPYVYFLMLQARQRGLKRLYFLSRDSYILMKMAEKLKGSYPDIDLRYLFVSRKSLLMPYLATNPTEERYLAVQDHKTIYGKKVESLLKPLGTRKDELETKYNISFGYDKIKDNEQERDFLGKIFGNDSFFPELQKHTSDAYALLKLYFEQEGLMDGTPSGMVDVGWLGTSRLMINSILKSAGAKETEFFYFGIRGDVLPSSCGVYSSFYRPDQLSTELTTLVENYFSASPYPSTTGYGKSDDGHITPSFANGQKFKETPITESNVDTSCWILDEMNKTGIDFRPVFWTWSTTAIDAISKMSVKIDLTPFVKAADFDDTAFVRKLSLAELFRLTLSGAHITAFDRASLRLSTGRLIDGTLWKLHQATGKLRRYLYLRLKK